MTQEIQNLNKKWGKFEHVSFSQNPNQPIFAELRLNQGPTCKLFIHGAHVFSFRDENDSELIFMSSETKYEKVRGGIPIVFPQFGPGKLPQHGFARDSDEWEIVDSTWNDNHNSASISLRLKESENTLKVWPTKFEVILTVRISFHASQRPVFEQTMKVTNTDKNPFEFTACFHTYFQVKNVREVEISKFNNVKYMDKVLNKACDSTTDIVKLVDQTDRVYYDAPEKVEIAQGGEKTFLETVNFKDKVVWNCWEAGAKKMADMGDNDWVNYVCVEAAAVKTPINLQPGETWSGTHRISNQKSKY
jgi:glucose-6-phosphate 1-epimerase